MSGAGLNRDYTAPVLSLRGREFAWGSRTYIMAIINRTPDSFSGDGLGDDVGAAVALARKFESEGADILDVGGESSRPGAEPLTVAEEIRRVVPAIEAIHGASGLPISVDTCHAAVAEAAIEAGAAMVNDIWGLRHDPELAGVVARRGVALTAMHNQRGRPFGDVACDIRDGWRASLELARGAGIDAARIIVDPGFGFGWTPEQNLEMLRRLPELWELRMPILVGTSRKSTLGLVVGAPVEGRLEATAASVALGIAGGADIVRVHDVAAMRRVSQVADAVCRANWRAP